MITLTMLLAGRLRDLQEARDTARIIHIRIIGALWRDGVRHTAPRRKAS